MLQELRRLAVRAAGRPGLLAYHLADLGDVALCDRLDCSLTTALLLRLSATPRRQCWRQDVLHLARLRRLDPAALLALLHEAEAVARPRVAIATPPSR